MLRKRILNIGKGTSFVMGTISLGKGPGMEKHIALVVGMVGLVVACSVVASLALSEEAQAAFPGKNAIASGGIEATWA